MVTSELYDPITSKKFYDQKFDLGYNKDWPRWYQSRIIEVIGSLHLPERGRALDYGCGNGGSTNTLKTLLPSWEISGCDISEVALSNASRRLPGCSFYRIDDPRLARLKFDFIFSHHVLEHVFDLRASIGQIAELTSHTGRLLLILPCGNPGSYEHMLAFARRDGIDPRRENRFFYETPGHVRRLTSDQLASLCREHGFVLSNESYSGHYWGGIETITSNMLFEIPSMVDPRKAKDAKSRRTLLLAAAQLGFIGLLRAPTVLYNAARERDPKRAKHIVGIVLLYLPSRLSWFWDRLLRRLDDHEWATKRSLKNGSAMYLYFHRT